VPEANCFSPDIVPSTLLLQFRCGFMSEVSEHAFGIR